MKRVLIAAATAAVLATSAFAGAASANAAEPAAAAVVKVGGYGHQYGGGYQHNGPGQWNKGQWHGQPKWKAKRACDPIVRWRSVGPTWHKRWQKVVVGWDCHQRHGNPSRGPW
jgi:hypothetical protein